MDCQWLSSPKKHESGSVRKQSGRMFTFTALVAVLPCRASRPGLEPSQHGQLSGLIQLWFTTPTHEGVDLPLFGVWLSLPSPRSAVYRLEVGVGTTMGRGCCYSHPPYISASTASLPTFLIPASMLWAHLSCFRMVWCYHLSLCALSFSFLFQNCHLYKTVSFHSISQLLEQYGSNWVVRNILIFFGCIMLIYIMKVMNDITLLFTY